MKKTNLLKILALSVVLTACGGGGTTSDQASANTTTASTGLRPLPAAYASKSVSYSPYGATNGAALTDASVKADLDLLVTAGIGLIRLFDSSDNLAQRTLRVIRANSMPIKVQLGMYVNSFEALTPAIVLDQITKTDGAVFVKNAAASIRAQSPRISDADLANTILPLWRASIQAGNEDEMARGVTLANTYPEVVAVSVGNETMVTWSFVAISTTTMAGYIKKVRDQIKQPVTTDDNYAFYAGYARNGVEQATEVFSQIDFASVHTYSIEDVLYSNTADADPLPDWDWKQLGQTDTTKRAAAMMDAALDKTKTDYYRARTYLNKVGRSNMPIIIGETGWKAADPSGTGRYKFLGHPANQKMFYLRLLDWQLSSRFDDGPKGIIYFEAFDEAWKGADDNWGLFSGARKARCAAQALNPSASWTLDTGNCNESAAVFFQPPTLNAAYSQPKLVIHNETTTGWPSDMRSDAYASNTLTLIYPQTGDSAPSDLGSSLGTSHFIQIDVTSPASYGWGVLWGSSNQTTPVTANMSQFAAGTIRFSIKTAYAGSLRIGISSDTDSGTAVESQILVNNGKYGYCNNASTWCDVSIPVADFVAINPKLDLRYILTRFSISDVWSDTGNTARTNLPTIKLDNIYWAQ